MSELEAKIWMFLLTILGLSIGLSVGYQIGSQPANSWREWQCAKGAAALVADTLCVRADSTWRVEEPGR